MALKTLNSSTLIILSLTLLINVETLFKLPIIWWSTLVTKRAPTLLDLSNDSTINPEFQVCKKLSLLYKQYAVNQIESITFSLNGEVLLNKSGTRVSFYSAKYLRYFPDLFNSVVMVNWRARDILRHAKYFASPFVMRTTLNFFNQNISNFLLHSYNTLLDIQIEMAIFDSVQNMEHFLSALLLKNQKNILQIYATCITSAIVQTPGASTSFYRMYFNICYRCKRKQTLYDVFVPLQRLTQFYNYFELIFNES